MTFSSMPWKRVEGTLLSIPETARITRSTPKSPIPTERTRHLTSVKFEKMTFDGYGERILRMLADCGKISCVSLSSCELFNISLETEEILERNKVKQLLINRCTIRIPKAKFRLIGGVEIYDTGKTSDNQDENILPSNIIVRKKTPAIEGSWANKFKWKYNIQLEDRKHLRLWSQTNKLSYNISRNIL